MSSEREKTMEEIIQDVRCFYHRGAPLFTRDELRRVADLIDKHAKGELENDKMLAKGINDAAVRVFPRGDGSYRKPKDLRIEYRPIETLTVDANPSCWTAEEAYLSIVPAPQYIDSYSHYGLGGTSSTSRTLSAAELGTLLSDAKKAWEATSHYRRLRNYIETYRIFEEVRKIVGLALGPLFNPNQMREGYVPSHGPGPDPSLTQYALLLSLRDLLADNCGGDIRCYAQDPILCPTATKILEDAGITVLKDPHGFLEIDDETFVVSISPNVPVKQIVADIARPVALMWIPDTDNEQMRQGYPRYTDPCSSRVNIMLENEYIAMNFPFSDPLRGTDVYMRRKKREGSSEKSIEP